MLWDHLILFQFELFSKLEGDGGGFEYCLPLERVKEIKCKRCKDSKFSRPKNAQGPPPSDKNVQD